jgi:hypothetical protein
MPMMFTDQMALGGKRPGAGRKKKGLVELSKLFTIRATNSQFDAWKRAARRWDPKGKMGDWARVILDAASKAPSK